MKWQIPAKTFLIGEYIALTGGPSIILTTKPCFELSLQEEAHHSFLHPDSPAGRLWLGLGQDLNTIQWSDPYRGQGGLGASSAQFIGTYLASCYLKKLPLNGEILQKSYYDHAWDGRGTKPSGYDMIAQSQSGCVYINQQDKTVHCYDWPFKDIDFILVHTGNKLATHHHLQVLQLPSTLHSLIAIVKQGEAALCEHDSTKLIAAVCAYQKALSNLDLVAPSTLELLKLFKANPDVLAVKGCGALGMDILLLIVSGDKLNFIINSLREENWTVLATSKELYKGKKLIELNNLS